MHYKRLVRIAMVIAVSALLMLPACSRKKSEQEITITLKTEGIAPSQPVVVEPAAPAKPARAARHETEAANRAREKRQGRVAQQQARTPLTGGAVEKMTQVAVIVPPASRVPSQETIAKQQIIAIIKRQKQAMVTKNVALALQDIAGSQGQNRQALEDYFSRYDKIHVDFSNISISVMGGTAIAVMDQRTSIVTKSVIPQTITELTKVQWTFVNEDNRWYISGTQILSKLKGK